METRCHLGRPWRSALLLAWVLSGGLSRLVGVVVGVKEPSVEELRSTVPAEMRPNRAPVPDEDNAAVLFASAVRGTSETTPEVRAALQTLAGWPATVPSDLEPMLPRIRSWLGENAEALNLWRSASRCRDCRFPPASVTNVADGLRELGLLSLGLLCDAYLHWRDGDRAGSVDRLRDAANGGALFVQGAPSMLHYLVGSVQRRKALETVGAAALRPTVTGSDLKLLAGILSSSPDESAQFRLCLRSELWDFIAPYSRLESVARNYAGIHTNPAALALQPEELRRPLQLVMDPKLLASHPRPLDAAKSFGNSLAFWTEVDRRVSQPWSPRELPDSSIEERERFVEEFAPIEEALEGEELPLSDEAVERAAPLFRKMEDPVGRLLASLQNFSGVMYTRGYEAKTRNGAISAVVAVRRWADSHGGALPDSLQDLVRGDLLPRVPMDAFSGAPLLYSKREGKLWSVGPNTKDDGGQRDPVGEGAKDDLVWSVIPLP
ncbi:MAG: hypothetical protein JNL10_15865 [Verrucomicrobiales bacterium]|nr:hypothetical protein [Verrucomicrobiales bacterium]